MTIYEGLQLLAPVVIALINAAALIVATRLSTKGRSHHQENEQSATNTPQENPVLEAAKATTKTFRVQMLGLACGAFGVVGMLLISLLFREVTPGIAALLLMSAVYLHVGWLLVVRDLK
ncbi:MAG: hypothetical protein FWH15_06360 [Betaproteobacteria bacterium]|nr:hypothetical protein [Betaproteobacteria bacterium]